MRHVAIAELSDVERRENGVALRHVLQALANPDPEGPFYKKMRFLRFLPGALLLWLLLKRDYNAFVFLKEDAEETVGEIYCQAHKGDGLHLFGIELAPELRGTGYSLSMLD